VSQAAFIVKESHRDNYAMILNATICDKRLSYKARGLHHYLLSKPTNWRAVLADLINQSDLDGKDSVTAGLSELETLGYLRRVERPKVDGRYSGFDIYVYETPISPDGTGEDNPQRFGPGETGNSPDETEEGFPAPVEPVPDNPLLQKKEEQKTDLEKKEINDSISDSEPVDLEAIRRRNDEIFNRVRA
jgi:hypothetical protein